MAIWQRDETVGSTRAYSKSWTEENKVDQDKIFGPHQKNFYKILKIQILFHDQSPMRKGLSKIAREHSKDRMMVSNSIELFGMEEKKILRSSNKTKIRWEK